MWDSGAEGGGAATDENDNDGPYESKLMLSHDVYIFLRLSWAADAEEETAAEEDDGITDLLLAMAGCRGRESVVIAKAWEETQQKWCIQRSWKISRKTNDLRIQ